MDSVTRTVETPPVRPDTAGSVDALEGDVDREPADTSFTTLDTGEDTGPEGGRTPEDAAGESGASGPALP